MCYHSKAFPSVTQHNHAAMHLKFFLCSAQGLGECTFLHRDGGVPAVWAHLWKWGIWGERKPFTLLYIEYICETWKQAIFCHFFLCTLGPSLWLCKMDYNRRVGLLHGFCHNDGVQKTVQVHQGYYEPQPWLWRFFWAFFWLCLDINIHFTYRQVICGCLFFR